MANRTDKAVSSRRALEELAKKYGAVGPDSLALDLSKEPERWHRLVQALGRKQAYGILGGFLCREFRLRNGRDFLFSDRCVARELGYHIDAYLWAKGFPGTRRHITTFIFSRSALDRHCRRVEIEEKDLKDLRQRLVFRYRRGVKERQAELARRAGK